MCVVIVFFFSSRRRHTRWNCDWSSDVCSSDLALRNSGARAGEVVAVHGIGGLGHLGVQYARQMGFETVAINRGNDKESLARQLGAHHYIDATATDVVAELQKLGGASVILATAPNAAAI